LLAHLEVLNRGPGYAGPLLVLDHLFDLGLAVGAMGLFVASGRRGLRVLGLEPEGALPGLLHGAAVGAGVWGLIFLVVGFAGLLTPPAIFAAVLLGAVLLRRDLADLSRLCADSGREIRDAVADPFLLGFGAVVATLVGIFLLLHGMAPPGDWDSLMYHLEVPNQWLAEGRIYVPEGNLHVAYTSLLQILYAPFLALGSSSAPALLNGLFALLLGLGTYHLGSMLLDARSGVYASIVLWASSGLLFVAVTARVDTTLAFYVLLGQGAVALALLNPTDAEGHLLRGALLLGLAAGIKYHALAFTAAVAPMGIWAVWIGCRTRTSRVRLVLLASGAFLVTWGPWMAKNVILLGAPFYPFFADRLLQPWLADLYGTSFVPPSVESRAFGALRQAREPFDLFALLLAPGRLTVEPEGVHYHTNLLFGLLPLWLLHLRDRAVAGLAVPAVLYSAGVAIIVSEINLRYLLPALPALTIAVSYFFVDGLERVLRRSGRRVALVALAAVTLFPSARSAYQWTVKAPVFGQAIGMVSPQEYLEAGFPFYAGLAGTVNRGVPEDGKVLLLWEARGFYLGPDYLPDNVATYWPLVAEYVERTEGCLEDTEITHVLAAPAAARYYIQRGSDPDLVDLEGFFDFADRCLDSVEVGPGFALYRLKGDGPS
ncbi:MAG: hypothetical protein ACOC5J_01060, partial [Gemmatimonadota bacterium]